MSALALGFVIAPIVLVAIGFGAYPLALVLMHRWMRRAPSVSDVQGELPEISIVIACHNGADVLRQTLLSLLSSGYPRERMKIVVVSDASSDGTDSVAKLFADQGVQLVSLPRRAGKTAAENAAGPHLTGTVVVCMDAGSCLEESALQRLVGAFGSAKVGVCSATDRLRGSSVGKGEALFTRLEMRIRSLESLAGVSVGASGNLYAMRRELFDDQLDPTLTRDFACVLAALAGGWECVTVEDAVSILAPATTLRKEFRRKRRTMITGIQTLRAYLPLANPFRHPRIALPLLCRKVCRWLIPPALGTGLLGVLVLAALKFGIPAVAIQLGFIVMAIGLLRFRDRSGRVGRMLELATFAGVVWVAGIAAWGSVVRGRKVQFWDPTPRIL